MLPFRHILAALLILAAGAASAAPRVSLVSGLPFAYGDAANGDSRLADVTADGRYVAIDSTANNFVAFGLDFNGREDVYLLDRSTGGWQLISHRFGTPGWAANGGSEARQVTPDGRFVLFDSYAADLLATPQSPQTWYQVYLYDRQIEKTFLISHLPGQPESGASAGGTAEAVSADGRWVLFSSTSPDLVPGSGSLQREIYLHDRQTGSHRLVSHGADSPGAQANDRSEAWEMSPDGRFVLFTSFATNLVSGVTDEANTRDVFLYDRDSGSIELISRHPSQALSVGGWATALSSDGRFVLTSSQGPLANGMTDTNGAAHDCFLHDRQTGAARLVSHNASAASTSGAGESYCLQMSRDGSVVYFSSSAGDLVAGFGDANGPEESDLYRFEAATGGIALVSHDAAAAGTGSNGRLVALSEGSVSPDGSQAMYASEATNLDSAVSDGNGQFDLFLYDHAAGGSTLISRRGATAVAAGYTFDNTAGRRIDGDGDAYFDSWFSLHADPAADTNLRPDVYRFTAAGGQSVPVSVAGASGMRALGAPTSYLVDQGRFILWAGWLHDSVTGSNQLIGHHAGAPDLPANDLVSARSIDAAGRYVLLESRATDLVAGVTDNSFIRDLFLYDRDQKTAALVTHQAGAPAALANADSYAHWLSADGRKVILESSATNLLAGGIPFSGQQLYFYDRDADQMRLLSHKHSSPLEPSAGVSEFRGISSDERYVLIQAAGGDLIPGFVDNNLSSGYDIYLYDRLLSQYTLISHQAGAPSSGGNGWSSGAIPNGDFRYVFFESGARDLVLGPDLPLGVTIYRWDRLTGANQVVTTLPVCTWASSLYDVSLDGRLLLVTTACGLVPGDSNGTWDVYLYDRIAGSYELISHQPGNPGLAKGESWGWELSDDGRRVTYHTRLGFTGSRATAYDRQTKLEIDLRRPAFDDGTLLLDTSSAQTSRDGNRILVSVPDPRAAPYDPNQDPEVFLVELSLLFADGFESGNTGAWSFSLP